MGTAGAIVVGAALVFVIASAVVAFRGWPQLGASAPASRVVITSPAGAGSSVSRRLAALKIPLVATVVARPAATPHGDPRPGGAAAHRATPVAGGAPRPVSGRPGAPGRVPDPTHRPTGGTTANPPTATGSAPPTVTSGGVTTVITRVITTPVTVVKKVTTTGGGTLSGVGATVTSVSGAVGATIGSVGSGAGSTVKSVTGTAGGLVSRTGAGVGGVLGTLGAGL